MRPMTPLSRDLHPSNGHRRPATADDVVVPISAAWGRSTKARPAGEEPVGTCPSDVEASELPGEGPDVVIEQEFPTELHWQILEMLTAGCDDEFIAHRLHLDSSTYRRLVADLANAAGACNRFQLALKARELGWV